MALQLQFGTQTLTGAQKWSEKKSSRINKVTVPRKHGAIIDDYPVLDPRLITVTGRIISSTATALRTSLNTLEAAVEGGRSALYLHSDRFLYAVKEDMDIKYIKGMVGTAVDWMIRFICEDPFWYATSATTDTDSISGTGSAETISVTPTGNANTPPVITYTPSSDCSSVRIYNSHSDIDIQLLFTGTISSGNELEIDCKNKTCKNNGVSALSDMTGDFFDLKAAAQNDIEFTSDVAGSTEIVWTDRWY